MPVDPTLLSKLAETARRDPGRPLVTYYDDSTGERVELSVATFENWVSKIANLVALELGLEAGDLLAVELPGHWQSTVLVVGGWAAGLCLQVAPGAHVALRVVGPQAAATAAVSPSDHVLACSLRPLGARFTDPLPEGWLDFAAEVPPQPDALLVTSSPTADDLALSGAGRTVSHAALLAQAEAAATRLGLVPGGRLVTDLDPAGFEGVVSVLGAVLAADASVVLVAPTTPDRRTAIADQERASVSVWGGDPAQANR